MDLRRSRRQRASLEGSPDIEANMGTRSKRITRASAAASANSVTVSRSSEDPSGETTRTLRLTVKMPAGKLREATGGRAAPRRTVNVFQENPIVTGPRTSRNTRKIVEIPTSDDDDDDEDDLGDQEEDEVDDEDAPGEEEEEDDEDADADGDMDMDDVPPQLPVRRATKAAAPRGKPAKSVEAKEMELEEEEEEEEEDELDEDEDEEALSDTDTDAEGELDDQDESAIPNVNVDDLDEEDEEDEEDEDMDSDAMALNTGRTTKRQRGNLGNDFLQLPMGKRIILKDLILESRIKLTDNRTSGEEAPDGRGTCHASCRNGPPTEEPKREAQ